MALDSPLDNVDGILMRFGSREECNVIGEAPFGQALGEDIAFA